jgi:hypothetical protein
VTLLRPIKVGNGEYPLIEYLFWHQSTWPDMTRATTLMLHSNLSNITYVATKVHMRLRKYTILICMHDHRELM